MQISLYVIITSVIIYSLTLVAKNAPVIVNEIMERVSWLITVIKPIIIGFAFAYLMDPVVSFFEGKYRKIKIKKIIREFKAPRTWAAVTSVLLLVIILVGLISLLVFSVTDQLRLASFDDIVKLGEEYINSLNSFIDSISNRLDQLDIQSSEFDEYFKNATAGILDLLQGFATSTLNSIRNFSGYLTTFIFSFIIGFYFLIDGRMFINYIKKVFRALFSDNTNRKAQGIVHDLDNVFSGYVRGQLTDAFVMMVLISLVLSVTGVKFAIVIGIFAGIGNLIPYFGPVVAYISTAIICLINGEIQKMIISIIALFVIQAIDGNFIGPKLLSRSIKIHPLIIIISLIFGSALGGFLGMLLAVPIGAYAKLVFVRFIDHKLERKEEIRRLEEAAGISKNKVP
jgi:predicted PurR-regulated permease PerM